MVINKIKVMKKSDLIISWVTIVFLGTCAVLWPIWLIDGYLEEWYPLIGSFIAIYGGLAANIVWLWKNRKKG
jgi:purine-cytosine permease-like protein